METLEPAGGSASTSGPVKGKDYEFEVQITSVTLKSSVKVKLEDTEIPTDKPHWTDAERKTIKQDWSKNQAKMKLGRKWFSKKPAVHAISDGPLEVEASIEVKESKNVEPDGELYICLGGVEFKAEATVNTAKGEKKGIKFSITKISELSAFIGTTKWKMKYKVRGIEINETIDTTWLELYFILDKPHAVMYRKGFNVEILRFLFTRVGVNGLGKASDVCRKIVRYCHWFHRLRYPVEKGGRSFYDSGPTYVVDFNLSGYMVRLHPLANCYDQAAATQSLGGATGVSIDWVYMDPYGYLNPTHLLGVVGLCNNPFHRAEFGDYAPLVDHHDERRTAFARHSFNSLGGPTGKILDACAEPHLGTRTIKQYIKKAIDTKMDRPGDEERNPQWTPGVTRITWTGLP